jgi:hypothetical protein
MGDIYKHAILNIAASSARDGNDGCLQDRDTAYVCHSRVPANHSIEDYRRMQNDLWPRPTENDSPGMTVSADQVRKIYSNATFLGLARSLELANIGCRRRSGI